MSPLSIVEDFDVFEDRLARLLACEEVRVVNEVDLERREEALGHRVVPAVALPTHARDETVLFEHRAVVGAGVLTAAVRVVHETIGGGNCGGDQVGSSLATHLFSTTQVWLSAVEPSRSIPGYSADAVALSLDGTTLTVAAQTSASQLIAAPVVNPAGDPPVARTDYVATYSRWAGGVFVAGGTSLADHSVLHDVWFQTIGGTWAEVTPHGGVSDLGTIRAMTYSYDDQKLWFIDEVPITVKTIHLTQGRLLRASPNGGLELLASWISLGLADKEYLSVDHDGSILATFALKNHGFVTAQLSVDAKTNAARVKSLYIDAWDKLHGAPFVSPVGYGFFVQRGVKDEVLRVRTLPTLTTMRNFDESLCQ